ncbi:MAG: DUF3784 domain-containing protein [Eubacteriales bacterium]|nr:DUF3784 domain-containing protein [Eubacteriales bacterium]
MGQTFDLIVIIASLGMGILLLTGHGDFVLNSRNDKTFEKRYDKRKVELASGVAFVISGVLTIIDMIIRTRTSSIIYLVLVIIDFAALFIYMNKKCKK